MSSSRYDDRRDARYNRDDRRFPRDAPEQRGDYRRGVDEGRNFDRNCDRRRDYERDRADYRASRDRSPPRRDSYRDINPSRDRDRHYRRDDATGNRDRPVSAYDQRETRDGRDGYDRGESNGYRTRDDRYGNQYERRESQRSDPSTTFGTSAYRSSAQDSYAAKPQAEGNNHTMTSEADTAANSDDSTASRERERGRRHAQYAFMSKNRKAQQGALFWDGFQWIGRIGTSNAQEHNATRRSRRVYIANLPIHLGLTEDATAQAIGEEMISRGLSASNPVLHVWFARDKGGTYGFVELATIEDTEKALQLDGMIIKGATITVKRPSDYQLPVNALTNPALPIANPLSENAMLALQQSEQKAISRIVRVIAVLTVDGQTDERDFADVAEDMQTEAAKHGTVHSCLMCKGDIGDSVKVGDALIEFDDLDSAEKCFEALKGRKYDGKPVLLASIDEEVWETIKPVLCHMNGFLI